MGLLFAGLIYNRRRARFLFVYYFSPIDRSMGPNHAGRNGSGRHDASRNGSRRNDWKCNDSRCKDSRRNRSKRRDSNHSSPSKELDNDDDSSHITINLEAQTRDEGQIGATSSKTKNTFRRFSFKIYFAGSALTTGTTAYFNIVYDDECRRQRFLGYTMSPVSLTALGALFHYLERYLVKVHGPWIRGPLLVLKTTIIGTPLLALFTRVNAECCTPSQSNQSSTRTTTTTMTPSHATMLAEKTLGG
ncbi:hypothetical protein NA57DRAFT_58721 [Rhizodiscina lignyota]|uniref:Uncharacterized protein n=1 Tax=Rhizodiscina lignyota TaxID=1504668 RepID=A0A9P4M8H9_9PEZI|nr:hypothetical protein NA57DRAFT_58721 [Rhizodiscina lignyota]